MKKLNISGNNLSGVDPGLLATALNRLEEVEMYGGTWLTVQQVEGILTGLHAGLVKKLDISYNNMSTVDPGLLASAVNGLKEVVMFGTELTVQQAEAILTQSLVKTSVRSLRMGVHRVPGLDEDLVGRARLAIRNLY